MSWDYFVTFNDGAQNSHELHILNVYSDPEFKKDVENLPAKVKSDPFELKTEPSFYEPLLEKYLIGYPELMHYLLGFHIVLPLARDFSFDIEWDNKDNATIKLNSDITKEDFMQIWRIIYRHKQAKYGGKVPKNKLPVDDKLLYAIFKEKQKKPSPSFSKIFELYQKGELDYYKGGTTNWLQNKDALERYYNRYKPQPIS